MQVINSGVVVDFRNAGIRSKLPLFSSTNYKNTILSGGKTCFFSISTAEFRILRNAFCEKCLYLEYEQESFPFVWL